MKKHLVGIEKKVGKCLPCGTKTSDQRMVYAKNYVDLSMAVLEKINTIVLKVKSYHTADRRRRESNLISEEDLRNYMITQQFFSSHMN